MLCGLLNGEKGVTAQLSGPPDSLFLKDGWYWMTDGMADPLPDNGPFKSRDEAVARLQLWQRRTTPGLRLLGRMFHPLSVQDSQAFAGAPDGAMIAYCDDGTTLIFDPENNCINEVLPEGPLALELSITEQGEVEREWTFKVVR